MAVFTITPEVCCIIFLIMHKNSLVNNSVIAELQRAKRASEAPWVRKIGNPSSRENLVMTSVYERANVRPSVQNKKNH